MAKKEKFHTEGTKETYELLQNMISNHHREFDQNEILILMKHGGWNTKGKTVFGKFKVLGDDLRSTWEKDAILYLNADMWNRFTEPQKRYVLDHALFSLDTKQNKHGVTLEAADGRPLLKTLPPDIEAYFEVIKRHGTITEEVKRLALAIKEVNPGQMTIEEASKATEEAEGSGEKQGPREGVRGQINPDGTVDVEDKNQMTLEEAAAAADEDGPPIPEDDDDLPF